MPAGWAAFPSTSDTAEPGKTPRPSEPWNGLENRTSAKVPAYIEDKNAGQTSQEGDQTFSDSRDDPEARSGGNPGFADLDHAELTASTPAAAGEVNFPEQPVFGTEQSKMSYIAPTLAGQEESSS